MYLYYVHDMLQLEVKSTLAHVKNYFMPCPPYTSIAGLITFLNRKIRFVTVGHGKSPTFHFYNQVDNDKVILIQKTWRILHSRAYLSIYLMCL